MKFDFCAFCGKFGAVIKVRDIEACKPCWKVFEMVFSAYILEQ